MRELYVSSFLVFRMLSIQRGSIHSAPGCLFGTFVLWWPTDDLDIVTLPMNGERLEPWQQLCELAVREQDRDHLVELIRVIDRLIAQKERRLQKRPPNAKRSLELNRH